MNIRKVFLFISILILVFSISHFNVNAQEESYEAFIKLKKDSMSSMMRTMSNKSGIEKLGIRKITANSQEELDSLIKMYENNPNIEYVEHNIKYSKLRTPNDTYYSNDWGLSYINAEKAWDITLGSKDIVIAVIDTGADLDHPDLVNKLIQGKDFVNNDMFPDDDDDEMHGTLVSQIIGAEANNSFGTVGVAWNCKLMPLKVLDKNGSGWTTDIANAIIYAADNGAQIINLSLGGSEPSEIIKDAVNYAYLKGVLLVAASGNDEPIITYPAAYREVMAVGAINEDGSRASYSCYGDKLSIVAPGTNIVGFDENENPFSKIGTSFAAPYVSGTAGLILSINPYLTNDQVQWIIESSAKDLGPEGWDEEYGYGVLDTYTAVSDNIKFFDNVEYKKIMNIFLYEVNNLDNSTKPIVIGALTDYFQEDDKIIENQDGTLELRGIYRLKDELENIFDIIGTSYLDKFVSLGVGKDREEALENIRQSLDILLDWTQDQRLLLLDYINSNDTESMEQILIEKKTCNPYIDDNNDLYTAEVLFNGTTTGSFGITRDTDYFLLELSKESILEFYVSNSEEIEIELYDRQTGNLIRKVYNSIQINLQSGEYYIKTCQLHGKWSNSKYLVGINEIQSYFGDFNKDSIIDIYDIVGLSKSYGKNNGDEGYDPAYDWNKDDRIDLLDLQMISQNYGQRSH